MKTIIHLDSVEKSFNDQVVIPAFSLSIQEGEFITLLGPSGCGKTTLMRMISGFEEPTSGHIYLDGKDVTNIAPYQRDMNMVFQHYALFPHMTVAENILFGLKMKNVPQAEQKTRLEEVLHFTQLTEYQKRKPKQLSGGQQQRVAIARAIINNPRVLLLDEPLGALDYQLRKNLQVELKNIQRNLGITFIYVTHDQDEAMSMSDRIAVVNQGRIEQLGTPEEIYYKPTSLFVATFIGENNIMNTKAGLLGVRPEKIRLYKENEEVAQHKSQGIIEDIIFLGNIFKVFVRAEDDIVITAHLYEKGSWYKGERVGVFWAEEDEVILR
ncbi:ABC transporter ATP-binding protein [Brevibacterium sp. JNUCC-42]|uniref:ABC transporter ATP-binding protein n=1 Tax=Brevibacillus laterosporus TaxID=1465 RepID=A0A502IG62_BRELA|nr:ABC transporter ATP-binding protein [Brevibacillus laterosporus]QDX91701.1 ABC transporter ATP-binding protein [Brevibacillus laterosporus]QOS98265.1 ABC transporter ATP-binding protein [Brevibacterium sp. JNUCC-42]TPG85919.1 ABC transporter ATP-binding protein [Brevibacillus laterosporus]